MRTVCGLARWAQTLVGRGRGPVVLVAGVRPLAGGRQPLLSDRLGEQRRGGARLDQADGTTCGSAVLVALAAWADPEETRRLDGGLQVGAATESAAVPTGVAVGFGSRYDARQKQVHRESARYWPQVLGTTPWGMVGWLRRHVPGAGPYRVRLVDDSDVVDLADAVAEAGVALAVGRPVPLLVGGAVPRHYVLALTCHDDAWRVYEPTSAQVRTLHPTRLHPPHLTPIVGYPRLHALLLPA